MPQILSIALPTPLRRLFEYRLPVEHSNTLPLPFGVRICVPFGKQTLVGILVSSANESTFPINKIRHAIEVLDQKPVVSKEIMDLCLWASNYYHHPIGEVLHTALPVQLRKNIALPKQRQNMYWCHTTEGKGLPDGALKRSKRQQQLHTLLLSHKSLNNEQLKHHGISKSVVTVLQKKGLITLEAPPSHEFTSNPDTSILGEMPQEPNDEQRTALHQIRYHHYNTYLLEGTTGSGKTEVYLHAITRALQAGQQALILVPEIGLTPQTLSRFQKRFNVNIVELHSNIAPGKRTQNWLAAATGDARIVIGTRLSIFTPMPKLGIIIIDEEHDLSFKQQDGFRYSARDIAIVRAHKLNIPLLMGSATPSLETFHNANNKRYQHLLLTQRAGNAQPPALSTVDMRVQTTKSGIAQCTLDAIGTTTSRQEQALIFINRRGFAPALLCQHCGWTANCKACDAKLTLHNQPRHLRCHHCNSQRPIPFKCPSCFHPNLNAVGQGTERCEELLQQEFPNIDVIRVDQDSMQRKNAMKDLNKRLANEKPCILVGTQMLAKGHHFPRVTLVVILDVDQGLFSGDFRGLERMGQQITQVSGRSGRGNTLGQVILQTYKPDHPMLQLLLNSGYKALAQQLLQERADTHLPPVSYMAILRAESKRIESAIDFLNLALSKAKQIYPPSPNHQYLGPIPALMERRNDRFRYQLQIKCSSRNDLQNLLKGLFLELEGNALTNRTRWSIDVDPQDMS